MNKEYMYVDGKVVVSDEFGMKSPIEYSDNIGEILVTENLIEEMEKKLEDKQKKLEEGKSDMKAARWNIILPIATAIVGASSAPHVLIPLLYGANPIVETTLGRMHESTLFMIGAIPGFSLLGGMISLISYSHYKKDKKNVKGLESVVSFLVKQLEEEKEKLNELYDSKTKETEKEINGNFSSKKVDDKEQLEELKKRLYLYYNCGMNEKKYLRYQANGTLREKLANEQYTEHGFNLIEEYLNDVSQHNEENGKARVLKPRNKNNKL